MYGFVKSKAKKYAVNKMCNVLGLNESGYYKTLQRKPSSNKRQILSVEISKILQEDEYNANYGIQRIKLALEQRGFSASKRTVYRAMEDLGILKKRRVPHGSTKATTEAQEKENIIKRDFKATTPMHKCLTDITEILTSEGKLYISAILDCFDGSIVGLQIDNNMRKELCIETVKQAFSYANKGLILHSDRGSQYTSEEFRKTLKKYGIIQSLSGTGHCYDNARMESFFATLKKELLYKIPTHKMTKKEVMTKIYNYIFAYYNTIRINTFNPGGFPPSVYRQHYYKNITQLIA